MSFRDPPEKHDREQGKDVGGYPAYPDDIVLYRHLAEFVGATDFTNGEERETGSFLVFCDDGQLKVMFKDAAKDKVGFTTLTSLDGLVGELNHKLDNKHVDWRRDKNRRRR